MSKYLSGRYEDNREFEDIVVNKENDLILGLRLLEGINIDEFNFKYGDNLQNKKIIVELINDGYLEIINGMLKCKSDYIYLLNNILEKIIGSDL